MFYESTRNSNLSVTSAEAIKMGIAPDGGLFVPHSRVSISQQTLADMVDMSYTGRAEKVLSLFLTDFTGIEIKECVEGAYNEEKFASAEVAPLHKLDNGTYILELYHGPTCAFKDFALQILPHFMPRAAAKTGDTDEIVILVATSGDTGKAALEGFRDVPGTKIIVFYPENGVSVVQKLQMTTQQGNNVAVVAVEGNFDDAQSGVKDIFTDPAMKNLLRDRHYKFSSANSINWGRLAPQIVYYFSAYLDMVKSGDLNMGRPLNFVVPTGNFGNILAGFYAKTMGLPVNRLICASNENNVLTDFIRTGEYNRKRQFHKTLSPSMDILISSNLERLLYELTDHDADTILKWMAQLSETGVYTVDSGIRQKINELFWSDFADDTETLATIKDTFENHKYLIDTHTAVGKNVYDKYVRTTGDNTPTVIASTASPFKFNKSVVRALLGEEALKGKDEFELLNILSRTSGLEIPSGLRDLDKKTVLHNTRATKVEMPRVVKEVLNIA